MTKKYRFPTQFFLRSLINNKMLSVGCLVEITRSLGFCLAKETLTSIVVSVS